MPRSLTTSQVKKAGRTLRYYMTGREMGGHAVNVAFEVLTAFRAAHAYPLVTANNGLRSMIRTSDCRVEVSQRLKRVPTILEKLVREPTLPLSSMQDIRGCRAILNSVDEIRRVEKRIQRNRPPVAYSDYISTRAARATVASTSLSATRAAGLRSSCERGSCMTGRSLSNVCPGEHGRT